MKKSTTSTKGSALLFSAGTHAFTKTGNQFFGDALITAIDDLQWTNVDIAVAWVRISGLKQVFKNLCNSLGRGTAIRLLVGIDKANTSYEALSALLLLGKYGNVETWIYHDENDALIFHPKLYLFRNKSDSRLLLGSSNLTGGGLYTNVEANIDVVFNRKDPTAKDIETQIECWIKANNAHIKLLDSALLKDLLNRGYVKGEKVMQQERTQSKVASKKTGSGPLFGRSRVQAPTASAIPGLTMLSGQKRTPNAYKTSAAGGSSGASVLTPKKSTKNAPALSKPTHRLIMRVRCANLAQRPTQIQIPFALKGFIGNVSALMAKPGAGMAPALRKLSLAKSSASGKAKPNTWKVDIPEVKGMSDPILVLTKTGQTITYRAIDGTTKEGQRMKQQLLTGLASGKTYTTVPSKPDKATLCQFV